MAQITASKINRVLLIVLILVLAGLLFRSPRPAQAQNSVLVQIQQVEPNTGYTGVYLLPGSQVVGFSCVIESSQRRPIPLTTELTREVTQEQFRSECFVASTRVAGK